jgi:predicted RNase H-like HicB family nuclease
MTPLVKITGIKTNLLVAISKRDGFVIADCPFLNVISSADTEEKALSNLKEEIDFLFRVCAETDCLPALLDKRTARAREPSSPGEFVQVETVVIDIPSGIPPELLKRFADATVSAP